jgi:hypothetical protein
MKTINYPTGRVYDEPQVLEIQLMHVTSNDSNGFLIIEGRARFIDRSRHIAGQVNFLTMDDSELAIAKDVLSSYDSGRYEAEIFANFK